MLTAEMNNESLRPRVSTTKKTKIAVATVLTTPATTTVQWEGRSRERDSSSHRRCHSREASSWYRYNQSNDPSENCPCWNTGISTNRCEDLRCIVAAICSLQLLHGDLQGKTHLPEFWPDHCCSKKMTKAITNRTKLPFPKKASVSPRPWRLSLSSKTAASISAISTITASESTGSLRKYARLRMASLCLSTDESQCGDSYRGRN